MKREKLMNYFKRLAEETMGDTTSDSEIIDWSDGTSISMKELEDEYYAYIDIYNDITDFTDDNDLDDIKDYEKIVEYATKTFKLNEDYFDYRQACLIDFIPYMIKKLNK